MSTKQRKRHVKKGLVMVNTGDGKGKTTAALGGDDPRLGAQVARGCDSVFEARECQFWRDSRGQAHGDRLDWYGRWMDVDE